MNILRKNGKIYILGLLFFANTFIFYGLFWESHGDILKVYFLDVGQGDAALIQSPAGGRILIDGGPDKEILSELGKVLPFYDRRIDVVLVSHFDKDHIGGLPDVFEKYNVGAFINNGAECETSDCEALMSAVEKSGVKNILAMRGVEIGAGDGAVLKILFPDRDVSGVESNDGSVVAKLFYGESSFLFVGDSPQKIENYLISLDGSYLKSDVLKVGHHGSRTSSSASFVTLVSPIFSIISAKENNSYGHPHKETVEILNKVGSSILGTLGKGMVVCRASFEEGVLCE